MTPDSGVSCSRAERCEQGPTDPNRSGYMDASWQDFWTRRNSVFSSPFLIMTYSRIFIRSQSHCLLMKRNLLAKETLSPPFRKEKMNKVFPGFSNLNPPCYPNPDPRTEYTLIHVQMSPSLSRPSLVTTSKLGTKDIWIIGNMCIFLILLN